MYGIFILSIDRRRALQNAAPSQSVKKAANRQNTKVRYFMGNVKKQRHCEPVRTLVWQSAFLKTPCYARCFDLLRKPKDYRTYVRRRLWFACLDGFSDLCQAV